MSGGCWWTPVIPPLGAGSSRRIAPIFRSAGLHMEFRCSLNDTERYCFTKTNNKNVWNYQQTIRYNGEVQWISNCNINWQKLVTCVYSVHSNLWTLMFTWVTQVGKEQNISFVITIKLWNIYELKSTIRKDFPNNVTFDMTSEWKYRCHISEWKYRCLIVWQIWERRAFWAEESTGTNDYILVFFWYQDIFLLFESTIF